MRTPLLVDILIDETIWGAAADDRRREWRLLITELLEHHPPDEMTPSRLRILPGGPEGTLLALEGLDGVALIEVRLAPDALAPHFRAYLDVCQQMLMLDEGSHSARLEALDMGKRVTHDRAGRSVMGLCGSIIPDHATARRLFSLLMSLEFDTSRMHRGHRAIPT